MNNHESVAAHSPDELLKRYRDLVETSPDIAFECDAGGCLTYLNPACETIFGCAMGKMLGRKFTDFQPSEIADRDVRELFRLKQCGMITEYETIFIGSSGKKTHVLVNAKYFHDEQGKFSGIRGTAHDITGERRTLNETAKDISSVLDAFETEKKRKKMEEELERAQQLLVEIQRIGRVGGWEFNIDTKKQTWTEEVYRIHEVDVTYQPVVDQGIDFYAPESKPIIEKVVQRAIEYGEEFNVELEIITAKGNRRWVNVIGKSDLEHRRVFGFFQDITERKASEQLFRDMQRRESIGILTSGIAHDYNNLLGIMMGNVSLAQTKLPAGHPAVKNIEKSISAMERAAELTKQMLAYSGKGKFQFLTLDVAAMVSEHVSLFTASLSKNVKLSTHLPSSPVYVNGDPGQIEQIIMNLIINGSEAIGDSRGVVSITLTESVWSDEVLAPFSRLTGTSLNEGAYALIEVNDTGKGMNRDVLTKIFDPFFTTKFTGRGLGLAAVLGIVQGHKGGITVDSTEGVGTTFRVMLPVVQAPLSVQSPVTDEGQHGAAVATTILVIDDESDVAGMAQDILETEKYTVLVELNPIRGIELFKQHRSEIGVVLLDMTMPEMSGKEVVDALRAFDPDVKIIITSGYSEDEVTRKLGSTKATAFIQKPYRSQSLLSMVHGVIH